MYEDSTRVGTTTATRQIPVSELLARHRGEQAPSHPEWTAPAPTACETTDVIPVVQDDYYSAEPYAATGYSEGYGYEYAQEEPADAVRPFVGVSADTDQFPMPALHEVEGEQTLLAPLDVEAMDAERAAAKAAARAEEPERTQLVEAETMQTPSCDDTPSREIYIRELLRREGRLPREQRRKQVPKIAAAAAGVAALCGAVAASIVHVQNADDHQNTANGNGVPLTVVDGGGPRGQALDAPLTPRGTEQVTPDNSTAGGSTATDKHASPPRVAPYVTASQQAQNNGGAAATTTTTTPPPSTTSPSSPPPSSTSPSSTPNNGGNNTTPPTSANNAGTSNSGNSTPPASTTKDTGLLGGLLNPITGALGL
ncbi:hypothetical protein [Kutzneria sp. CA-103260]|uniref:hypothetical protein n=1 Tax=Kutzneria sp. CA-103260 TaxID=2802641 RepID=UPI001BAE432B|nr:hypothetical protein [Kutzneria sp. CA-103260]QUQ70722.1 hypothetical protein JJ691_85050 [Kutzneria sp. CA-103260]